ncbi:MAG: class II fructose-bisphosphate aldolase [Clostridia bacterium]|nr:class II fructose-bisphosphate aldolase [Clostridia bacterium]
MLVNLNDVLLKAQKEHYAVGLFNTVDTDMLEAAITAAEELRSPIIIGTAEVLLPYGGLEFMGPAIVSAAKKASVPVVVHFDHGVSFDNCMLALKCGYSSVMFDGSAGDPDDNIRATAEMVKIAHAFGATVEGEIGHVGQAADGDGELTDSYTTPGEAEDFISRTGVDALAVAIGTAHGVYKTKPKLDTERLSAIRSRVDTPLVLHGGSGLSDDDFRDTIRKGIAKINIFTDLCLAGTEASLKASSSPAPGMMGYLEMRNARVDAMKQAVKRKMLLFGSENKA